MKLIRDLLAVIAFLLIEFSYSKCDDIPDNVFYLSKNDINLLEGSTTTFDLVVRRNFSHPVLVHFYVEHEKLAKIEPNQFYVQDLGKYNVKIWGLNPGLTFVTYNVSETNSPEARDFIRLVVQHSYAISLTSTIVGWTYFIAWSVSFYPQIYINFKRRSVIGINFDFVGLNVVGFCLYAVFNLGLRFVPIVQEEYYLRNPKGLNPVQINDVVFSTHAVAASAITLVQCFIYERGNQQVSILGCIMIALCCVLVILNGSFAVGSFITWLDFLYYCSYIKLGITLIKYIPQAYMNYKRKSTYGWSIGNIFLDFTGGILSILQMLLNAYNYDDWISIFGDPTKFGLGLFSVIFDIFFIVQHYVLYRNSNIYEVMNNEEPCITVHTTTEVVDNI